MESVLTEIIGLLVGGIKGIASGIGSGLQELVKQIFLDTSGDTTKLSVYGAVICIFAGVSLAVGLSRMIVTWVSSLGN